MPAPERPTSAIVSPGRTSRSTPARTPLVAARVGEPDPLEGDPPGDRGLRHDPGAGRRGHLAGLAEEVEDAVEPREVVLELRGAGGQHGDRLQEHRQVDQEHHQVADREPAVEHAHPPEEEQGPRGGRQEQVPGDLDDPAPAPGEHLLPDHQVVVADEPARLAALAAEGADDAHPAERLGGAGVDLLPLLSDVAVERPEPAVPEPVGDRHRRRQEDRPEQQPPVDPDQDRQPAEELDHRPPRVVQHAEDQLAHAAGVLAEQAGDAPRLELIHPVQREPRRVIIDPPAHRHLEPLARPRGEPAAGEADGGPDQRDGEDDPHQREEPPPGRPQDAEPPEPPVLGRPPQQDVVDHQLRRRGRDQPDQRRDRQQEERRDDPRRVPPADPEQLAIERRQAPLAARLGRLAGSLAATRCRLGATPPAEFREPTPAPLRSRFRQDPPPHSSPRGPYRPARLILCGPRPDVRPDGPQSRPEHVSIEDRGCCLAASGRPIISLPIPNRCGRKGTKTPPSVRFVFRPDGAIVATDVAGK